MKKIVIWILTLESRLILRKYKPFIVAVTGSVGKTSTKDAIYSVIKNHGRHARKTEKSMNSEIGLPLTVIGAPNAWRSLEGWIHNILIGLQLILFKSEYPDCLVVEVGADHPGDIRRVTKWLKPDIAVITKVSQTPVHVEFFSSPEQVFEEKALLAENVKKGGTVVLFADDQKVMSIAERVKDKGVTIITFGMNAGSNIRGWDDKVEYSDGKPVGITFTLEIDGSSVPIRAKKILGRPHIYPLLAAAAVGKARGMTSSNIIDVLESYDAPKGRLNIIPGIKDSTIIDDSYNSSPDAVVSALDTLKLIETKGSKIAVLGDMMELGSYTSEEHKKVGALVPSVVSKLITVGVRSRATADEAIKSGMKPGDVKAFDKVDDAIDHVISVVGNNDIILVKGSQSVRVERVVKALMQEPEKASERLVRQEEEWLRR